MKISKKQGNEQAGQSVQSGKKVIRGKVIVQNSGACKYGRWSHAGMKCFNELYDLVVEDRACPQADAVEKEFLDYCIKEYNKRRQDAEEVMNRLPLKGQPACCNHAIFGRRWI
jgi:hypothetical protein